MSKFNLNEYETVKQRKERFYNDHADGRIVVELCNTLNPLDYALFVAKVYLNKGDQEKGLCKATGYALEVRDTELKTTKDKYTGELKEYESVNYSSWTENCEESAVGRALDNAGYSGNKKPSRDEMEKAQRMNTTMIAKNTTPKPVSKLSGACPIHPNETLREYISNKTGNPFFAHINNGKYCFGKN